MTLLTPISLSKFEPGHLDDREVCEKFNDVMCGEHSFDDIDILLEGTDTPSAWTWTSVKYEPIE